MELLSKLTPIVGLKPLRIFFPQKPLARVRKVVFTREYKLVQAFWKTIWQYDSKFLKHKFSLTNQLYI